MHTVATVQRWRLSLVARMEVRHGTYRVGSCFPILLWLLLLPDEQHGSIRDRH